MPTAMLASWRKVLFGKLTRYQDFYLTRAARRLLRSVG